MQTAKKEVHSTRLIYEGRPDFIVKSKQRWIRLLVHRQPTEDDAAAVNLFNRLAAVLKETPFGEYFVLSVFRIGHDEEQEHGELPRIVAQPPVVGLKKSRST